MKDNVVLKEILTEMCKRVGADYDDIDFKKDQWFMEYRWTQEEQESFSQWMEQYLMEDKKRIDKIAQFSSLIKSNKKARKSFIDKFLMNYGWRYKTKLTMTEKLQK